MSGLKRGANSKKCLTCSNDAFARGLCARCYQSYRANVARGAITEQTAIDEGMILKPKSMGPKAASGFSKRLSRLKTPNRKGNK